MLKQSRFDLVLRLTRADESGAKAANLVVIALALDSQRGDRTGALKLLEEAEVAVNALPRHFPGSKPVYEQEAQEFLNVNQMFVAYGYQALGDEINARKWLDAAISNASPQRAASLRVQHALMPLLYSRTVRGKESLSIAELTAIDAAVSLLAAPLEDVRDDYGLLRTLVEAQIKARQFEAARAHLPTLERLALAQIPKAKDINGFTSALQVANDWRQCGDETRAQGLLLQILNAPGAETVTKRNRANAFITHGFVEEGRTWLKSLPKAPRDMQFSPSVAYWQGKYQPDALPQWILQIKEPRQKLQALQDFAQALTEPIFNSAGENEYVLTQTGSSGGG